MKKIISMVLTVVLCLTMLTVVNCESNELLTIRVMGIDQTKSANGVSLSMSDMIEMNSPVYQEFCRIMEKHGVKIVFDLIPDDQYAVICQTRLAGGLDCDWMNITPLDTQTRQQMIDHGMLRSFNEVIELSAGEAKSFMTDGYGAQIMKLYALEDGNCYWVPAVKYGYLGDQPGGSYMSMIVRQDWLTKLGMEMPKTAEDFKAMLVAFQENDMNGNGEKDEVISVTFDDFANGIAQWFGIGPGLVYLDTVSGEVRTPWYSENIKSYISYMKDLVDSGLVDTSNQGDQKTIENKISATYNWSAEQWLEPTIQIQEGAAAGYYVPMYASAVEGVAPYLCLQTSPTYPNYQFAMINNEGNSEALARFIDAIYDEEMWNLGNYSTTEVAVNGQVYKARECVNMGLDENGEPIWKPFAELSEKEQAVGPTMSLMMWSQNGCIPYISFVDRADEIDNTIAGGLGNGYPETGWLEKGEAFRSFFSYEYTTPYSIGSVMPAFTANESEKIAEIETDLGTYSSELVTKLIFGQKSLDDWDNYMTDLLRLKLDEYVQIYQTCYDRTK